MGAAMKLHVTQLSRLILLFIFSCPVLFAANIYISPTGKDGAAGTENDPLRKVQDGLDRAKAGDTVLLLPGVYRERVRFNSSGEYGKPVVLSGSEGAILEGCDDVQLDWQPAPDISEHTYRAALPFPVITVTAGGKIITILDERRVDPENIKARIAKANEAIAKDPAAANVPRNKVDEQWQWPLMFKNGIAPTGWKGFKALAMYHSKNKELLVCFGEEGLDPRKLQMTVAQRVPIITISGTNRCVVRNLTIRYGWNAVHIEKSLGSVVENCRITGVDFGVYMAEGAKMSTVRFNEISLDPYAGASPFQEGSWENWQAHKLGGFYDREGVDMRHTDGGHRIHDNYIHDHWGGIQDVGEIGENMNLDVHHNRVETICDDGLEPNGAEENCQWHDNIVNGCICGFRIKCVKKGPLYAYRNIFYNNKEDYRNYGEHEMQPAQVYVYHNTSTAEAAVTSNKVFGIGTPNYYFMNNLFYCGHWFQNAGKSVNPNWHGDFNAFIRRSDARATEEGWDKDHAFATSLNMDLSSTWLKDAAPGFTDYAAHDFSLLENSPAREKGTDLAEALKLNLPGLEGKYYSGQRPDAGAVQYGQPMPVLPRPATQVTVEEAGFWPAEGSN